MMCWIGMYIITMYDQSLLSTYTVCQQAILTSIVSYKIVLSYKQNKIYYHQLYVQKELTSDQINCTGKICIVLSNVTQRSV